MQLSCPKCSKEYLLTVESLPPSKEGPDGYGWRVSCNNCSHKWWHYQDKDQPMPFENRFCDLTNLTNLKPSFSFMNFRKTTHKRDSLGKKIFFSLGVIFVFILFFAFYQHFKNSATWISISSFLSRTNTTLKLEDVVYNINFDENARNNIIIVSGRIINPNKSHSIDLVPLKISVWGTKSQGEAEHMLFEWMHNWDKKSLFPKETFQFQSYKPIDEGAQITRVDISLS
ncbi:MAG: hypothetical protein ACTSXG_04005 [Alphaproteobacteria bacterium]